MRRCAGIHYCRATRPGVANLIDICAGVLDRAPAELVAEQRWESASALKRYCTDVLVEWVAPIGARIRELQAEALDAEQTAQRSAIDDVLDDGARRARAVAQPQFAQLADAVGLRRGATQ